MLDELSLEDLIIVQWLLSYSRMQRDPKKPMKNQWYAFPSANVTELGFSYQQIAKTLKVLERQGLLEWSLADQVSVYKPSEIWEHTDSCRHHVYRLWINEEDLANTLDLYENDDNDQSAPKLATIFRYAG